MMTCTHKKMPTMEGGTSRSYKIKRINLQRLKRYLTKQKNQLDKQTANGKFDR